jgi:hypothetical protein
LPDFDPDAIKPAIVAQGRRNESALHLAARTVSHSEAARRLGVPKQTLDYWLKRQHFEACLVYAAHGLKLVPVTDNNYTAEDIAAMAQLAEKGLRALRPLRAAFLSKTPEDDDDAETTIPGALGDH